MIRNHRYLLILTIGLVLSSALFIRFTAQGADTADIEGVVQNSSSQPIHGAQVAIEELGLTATTDESGQFRWSGIAFPGEILTLRVSVHAEGYGDWRLQNVRLIKDDVLIITAELGPSPITITLPPPIDQRITDPNQQMGAALFDSLPLGSGEFPLPETIRVRVTGNPYCNTNLPYTVETVDFKEYVKHVLPNEWIASWPAESLRAGAMAAKMYAWSIVAAGGRWSDADVYDSTCDQVYNPTVEYRSTNLAVDFTWNWMLLRDNLLVRTYYRAYYSQCLSVGLGGNCMGQYESADMGYDGHSWDEILQHFYSGTHLSDVWAPPGGYSLRFNGTYADEENRVRFAIDNPANTDPGPPLDIGSDDFTIEWWMKATPGENAAEEILCGANQNWLFGNMLFDRDRYEQDRKYGIAVTGGRLVFGTTGEGSGDLTICGTTDTADGEWHHIAVQRRLSDGWISIFIDGILESEGDGPDGDLSYPDDYSPPTICGPTQDRSCVSSDPFLVIGAEKHRAAPEYPSFKGWLDEIRFSDTLRYSGSFTPPDRFSPDPNTVALFHLDKGYGNDIHDTAGYPGGPSDGMRIYGGSINGPEWSVDSPWYVPPPEPTSTPTPSPIPSLTSTPTVYVSPTPSPTQDGTTSPTTTESVPTDTPTPTIPTLTPTATQLSDTPTPTSTPTPGAPPADLDGDGSLNVVDIQLGINVILGLETDTVIATAADVNRDGAVDVIDIQQLINWILFG